MEVTQTECGPRTVFSPEETKAEFLPLRNRIFYAERGVDIDGPGIFRIPSWTKVIIRGGVYYSDRTNPPVDLLETVEDWVYHDARDELQPLFDLLVEDGNLEVIHMSPFNWDDRDKAIATRPTGAAVRGWFYDVAPRMIMPTRLLFDRSGRWGMYADMDTFGMLGGEPEFMARFIERSRGMEFIRQKADYYWQDEIDVGGDEAELVPEYYQLAGWDNPPRKRTAESG